MIIRVVLADDSELYRRDLRKRLDREPGLEVVAEAEDGEAALRLARELAPDVVILDVVMPGASGIETTRRIVASCPEVKVIGLSMHADKRFVSGMLEAGARDYFLKDGDFRELVKGAFTAAGGSRPSAGASGNCPTRSRHLPTSRSGFVSPEIRSSPDAGSEVGDKDSGV